VAEGVIRVGQAKTFPSLFAHAEFNAVTIVSDRHYLKPGELGSEILADALEASVRYLRLVNEKNANVTWGAVLMNCLTPAGSTVVHPHMQALASDQPFNALSEMDRKAREYWQAKGSSFWKDLVMTEQEHMERYLGLLGDTDWIMAYSPVGNDEAWGITRECDDLVKISRVTLTNLAAGLSRVLHYYDECGIRSFNVAVCSPPFGASASHGSVVLKVASRYGFQSHNVNDVWGLRYFLDQSEVFDAPEDVATQMRRHFV
jgi:galactose-1-phosphate uridylyltransferase